MINTTACLPNDCTLIAMVYSTDTLLDPPLTVYLVDQATKTCGQTQAIPVQQLRTWSSFCVHM